MLQDFGRSLVSGTSPFDLHVLGTPPAFILSQDQTLMFKFNHRYKTWLASLTCLLVFPVFLLFLGCASALVLLNFQDPKRSFLEFSGLHYCLFVKVPVVLKINWIIFFRLCFEACIFESSSEATLISYHFCFCLSRLFLFYFQTYLLLFQHLLIIPTFFLLSSIFLIKLISFHDIIMV